MRVLGFAAALCAGLVAGRADAIILLEENAPGGDFATSDEGGFPVSVLDPGVNVFAGEIILRLATGGILPEGDAFEAVLPEDLVLTQVGYVLDPFVTPLIGPAEGGGPFGDGPFVVDFRIDFVLGFNDCLAETGDLFACVPDPFLTNQTRGPRYRWRAELTAERRAPGGGADVPLPATAALFLTGAATLAGLRRKRGRA